MKAAIVLAVVLLFAGCNAQRHTVPSGAYPEHFKKLVAWDACGASGEYCVEVMVFGSDEISFETAITDIEQRYLKKGWAVRRLDESSAPPGIALTDQDQERCVLITRFDGETYGQGPSAEKMSELVAPYSTLIIASAGCG